MQVQGPPAIGMNPDELINKLIDMMQSQFGLKPKDQVGRYRSPYQTCFDIITLPPCYRVPVFSNFLGTYDMSTMERINRYIAQLGEASKEEAHKVRFFPLSLSRLALTWFSSLEPNSITGWADVEKKFHAYFYTVNGEK